LYLSVKPLRSRHGLDANDCSIPCGRCAADYKPSLLPSKAIRLRSVDLQVKALRSALGIPNSLLDKEAAKPQLILDRRFNESTTSMLVRLGI